MRWFECHRKNKKKKQIPCGDDNKKGNGKCTTHNSTLMTHDNRNYGSGR